MNPYRQIDTKRVQQQELAASIVSSLQDAFKQLKAQAPTEGSHMNYDVCAAGLEIDNPGIPGWLQDVVNDL